MNKKELKEMIAYCNIMMDRIFNRCKEAQHWSELDLNENSSYIEKKHKYYEQLNAL